MKKLCKWFGHKYDDVDLLMFEIQCAAINRKDLEARIQCKRHGCSHEVVKKKGV